MQRCFESLPSLSINDCSVAEQFVIGACRCWDAFTEHPDATLPWRQLAPVFAYMNVLGAMCAFERLFSVLTAPLSRRLCFCEVDAVLLHADEARVLSALAALQDADARSAVRRLREALGETEVRSAMPALARIASILDGQGHRLPRWQPAIGASTTARSRMWTPWSTGPDARRRSLNDAQGS